MNLSHDGLYDEEFVGQIVDALCDHGLRLPALVGLEAGRPLSLIGGQVLWLLQPLLSLFTSKEVIGRLAETLEQPEAVDLLIERLGARES
jgi:hypothetical protein